MMRPLFKRSASISIVEVHKIAEQLRKVEAKKKKTRRTVKSISERNLIYKILKNNRLFSHLSEDNLSKLMRAMYSETYEIGEQPITQGDIGDCLYIVQSGGFDVFITNKYGVERKVSYKEPAHCFGEVALMYNMPRKATVRAVKKSVVWIVSKRMYRKVLGVSMTTFNDDVFRDLPDYLAVRERKGFHIPLCQTLAGRIKILQFDLNRAIKQNEVGKTKALDEASRLLDLKIPDTVIFLRGRPPICFRFKDGDVRRSPIQNVNKLMESFVSSPLDDDGDSDSDDSGDEVDFIKEMQDQGAVIFYSQKYPNQPCGCVLDMDKEQFRSVLEQNLHRANFDQNYPYPGMFQAIPFLAFTRNTDKNVLHHKIVMSGNGNHVYSCKYHMGIDPFEIQMNRRSEIKDLLDRNNKRRLMAAAKLIRRKLIQELEITKKERFESFWVTHGTTIWLLCTATPTKVVKMPHLKVRGGARAAKKASSATGKSKGGGRWKLQRSFTGLVRGGRGNRRQLNTKSEEGDNDFHLDRILSRTLSMGELKLRKDVGSSSDLQRQRFAANRSSSSHPLLVFHKRALGSCENNSFDLSSSSLRASGDSFSLGQLDETEEDGYEHRQQEAQLTRNAFAPPPTTTGEHVSSLIRGGGESSNSNVLCDDMMQKPGFARSNTMKISLLGPRTRSMPAKVRHSPFSGEQQFEQQQVEQQQPTNQIDKLLSEKILRTYGPKKKRSSVPNRPAFVWNLEKKTKPRKDDELDRARIRREELHQKKKTKALKKIVRKDRNLKKCLKRVSLEKNEKNALAGFRRDSKALKARSRRQEVEVHSNERSARTLERRKALMKSAESRKKKIAALKGSFTGSPFEAYKKMTRSASQYHLRPDRYQEEEREEQGGSLTFKSGRGVDDDDDDDYSD